MVYIHIYGKYFDLGMQFEYTSMHYIATMWQNTYLVFKSAYCELENNAYSTYVINDIPKTHFTACFLYANLLAYIIGSGLSLNIYISISVIKECSETQYRLFLFLIINVHAKSIYWKLPDRDIYVKATTYAYDIPNR